MIILARMGAVGAIERTLDRTEASVCHAYKMRLPFDETTVAGAREPGPP